MPSASHISNLRLGPCGGNLQLMTGRQWKIRTGENSTSITEWEVAEDQHPSNPQLQGPTGGLEQ